MSQVYDTAGLKKVPAAGGGAITNINVSAGTTSNNLSAITLSNSNGISFGLNGSTVTASHNAITTETPFGVSAGTQSVSTGTLVFSNSNNVTFGMSGSSRVTASFSTTPETPFGVSAGTQSVSTGTLIFSDSNGISFGMSGSSRITASYTVPTQTNQTGTIYAASNTTGTSSGTYDARTLSIAGDGIISVAASNSGWRISATQSNQNVTADNGGFAFQTLSFSNLNGISFGTSAGSAITASHNAITTGRASTDAIGLNTAQTNVTWTVNSSGLSFNAGGYAGTTTGFAGANISGSMTHDTLGLNLSLSVAAPGGGAQTAISGIANSQTTYTSGSVTFSELGAITIRSTTGQQFQFSVNSQTNQSVGLYALGNTTQNSSTTLDARTLSFNGLGGMTVGYSNGSIQLSAPTTAAQTNQTVGLYGLGNTTQNSSTTLDARTLSFNGLGGMTVGYSNGSIQLSAPTTAAQTAQTVGLYALGNTTQNSSTTLDARTLSFNGLGANTVGYSNGSIQISGPSSATTISGITSADVIGTRGSRFALEDHQHQGVYAAGASTMGNTAGDVAVRPGQLVLVGGANITLSGATAAGSLQTISIVGGAGAGGGVGIQVSNTTHTSGTVTFQNANGVSFGSSGAAGVSVSHDLQFTSATSAITSAAHNSTLGVIRAAYDGANSISTGTIRFTNANGVSFSINGQTVSGSVIQPATLSHFMPFMPQVSVAMTSSYGVSTAVQMLFQPFTLAHYLSVGVVNVPFQITSYNAPGTSTGRATKGMALGIYSRNGDTLSRIVSTSCDWNISFSNSSFSITQRTATSFSGYAATTTTGSAGLNITSQYTGLKMVGFPLETLLSPGVYWIGLHITQSTSGNSVGPTMQIVGGQMQSGAQFNFAPMGSLSSSFGTIASYGPFYQLHGGIGAQIANTAALADSMAFSALNVANQGGNNSVLIPYNFWRT